MAPQKQGGSPVPYEKIDHPERPCSICEAKFKPKTIRSTICESEDCRREHLKAYQKEYQKKYHRMRMEDPKSREKKNEYQRKYYTERSKDPTYKEGVNKKCRERYRSDPEYREKKKEMGKKGYHKRKG